MVLNGTDAGAGFILQVTLVKPSLTAPELLDFKPEDTVSLYDFVSELAHAEAGQTADSAVLGGNNSNQRCTTLERKVMA
jgi:hypothetical protein